MPEHPGEPKDAIAALTAAARERLRGPIEDLCHDLGKYVHFQARSMEAGAEGLNDALIADLVHTHRGPTGSRSSVVLWEALRKPLDGPLAGDTDYVGLCAAMNAIDALIPTVAAGTAPGQTLSDALAAAQEVQRITRALRARIRS